MTTACAERMLVFGETLRGPARYGSHRLKAFGTCKKFAKVGQVGSSLSTVGID